MQAIGLILLFFKKLQSTILFEHCHEKIFSSLHVFSRDLKQRQFNTYKNISMQNSPFVSRNGPKGITEKQNKLLQSSSVAECK